jgi:hypothetical protein
VGDDLALSLDLRMHDEAIGPPDEARLDERRAPIQAGKIFRVQEIGRMMGSRICDGYRAEWCTTLWATTPSASSQMLPPVFRFRANLGKFELETSMRIRCPGANQLLVDNGVSLIS